MMYLKLDEDMNLAITVNSTIRRGDRLSKLITFLVPLAVGEIDPLTATVFLCSIRADGQPDMEKLDRSEEKYNDSYYQYTIPVTSKLSRIPGESCIWLEVFTGTPSNPTIAKSNECMLYIEDVKNMDDYLSDSYITALYAMQTQLDTMSESVDTVTTTMETVTQSVETVTQNVETLTETVATKADNIVFDSTDSTIQLTSNGEAIGDKITVSTANGTLITAAEISDDGELVFTFSDGSTVNVGNVVGSDGAVYVPHIDEYKVLTFTIETEATTVPDPVDLNPSDEWSSMEESDEGVVTDYIWDSI